ncbi:MAG: response regulator, partial [Spirochaetaceae bacterium]
RGVGLGLAIVRQVVTAMGGTVTVESEVGAGSRFRVELPFGPAPALPVAGPAEDGEYLEANVPPECRTDEKARPEARTTSDASKCPEAARAEREDRAVSVLICEDEAINRLYLTRLLETFGYRIEVAIDGVEAVERVQAGTYDLVLMDVGMPRMSGPEATRRLRAHEREKGLRRTPVIALTAHTYDEDVRICREAGMDGFVSKPIRESALAEEISRFLG